MVELIVLSALVIPIAALCALRAVRRRRDARTMVVITFPEIELNQPYGGWNADAYDAGTGHDRSRVTPWPVGPASRRLR
jgi:hypothetical protein